MEITEVRLATIDQVRLDPPIFRNRKDWRRYQVAMKRMRAKIDEQMTRLMFGPGYDPNSPGTTYPPRSEPRRSFFSLATMS